MARHKEGSDSGDKHKAHGKRCFAAIKRNKLRASKAREAANVQEMVLIGISRLYAETATCTTECEIGSNCLRIARELTKSDLGFICETRGDGKWTSLASNVLDFDLSTELDDGGSAVTPIMNILYERLAVDEEFFFTDELVAAASDSWIEGIFPVPGWFLAVPLQQKNSIIGIIIVGKREEGYSSLDLAALKAVSGAAVQMLLRRRAETAVQECESRLRILSREFRAADRKKDEFLGILSHEIRNPLASIMMSLSLLERTKPGGEQFNQAKEIMRRQITQLSRLVDDLLDVTRITRNKIILQNNRIEFNDLVRRTIIDYEALFHEKNVDLLEDYASVELYVDADSARLSQVVGNLLHNALKFTASGGNVTVTVAKEDLPYPAAVFVIKDSGIGIAPEVMSNLFQPFTQADTSIDRSMGGLGLGLALVKGLLDLHRGEVQAYSDGPGRGAVFHVRLPLSSSQSPVLKEKALDEAQYTMRKILIIEDIKDVADTLSALLRDVGHQVEVAYNGIDGIEKARVFNPEVLICDIGLPVMDGYQIAKIFRADEQLKDVYLIALSGYARPDDQQRARKAGFHCHLAKPVNFSVLQERIARLA